MQTAIYLLLVAFFGGSLVMLADIWAGAIGASVLLLVSFGLERWLAIPLRLGRFPIAALLPLLWVGVAVTLAFQDLPSSAPLPSALLPTSSQDLEATAHVDKTALRVEKDTLRYTLTIRYKTDLKPEIPKITTHPTFNGPFLMPADKPPKINFPPQKDGFLTKTWEIYLVAIATGPLDMPEFVIHYRRDGKRRSVTVPKIAVEVSEIGKPQEILSTLAASKGPILPEAPDDPLAWLWWSIVSATTLAFGLGLWWFRRQKTRTIPSIPPHEWFDLQMSSLAQSRLLEEGQTKAYAFALSEIFRGYIERRYPLPALESTSEEILSTARQNDLFAQDIYRDVRKILLWLDGVKFAGQSLVSEEREDIEKHLHSVVRRTRLQPDEGSPPLQTAETVSHAG